MNNSLEFLLDEKAIETLLTPENLEECISSCSEENEGSSPNGSTEVDFSELSPLMDFSKEINSGMPSGFWDLGSLPTMISEESFLEEISSRESSPLQSSPSLFIKEEPKEISELHKTLSLRPQKKVVQKVSQRKGPVKPQTPLKLSIKKEAQPIKTNLKTESVVIKQEKANKVSGHKRRRPQFEPVETEIFLKDGHFTELSFDDLIKLDGDQIELYIQTLHSHRNVSSAEEKEIKRVRRLIKNREYAQSSRNKKKEYVDIIEQEVDELKKETVDLTEKVDSLEEENSTLRSQLIQIGNLLKGVDNEILKKVMEITSAFTSPLKEENNSKIKRPTKKAKNVAFIFLFTFVFSIFSSFFFHNPTVFNSPAAPYSSSTEPSSFSTIRILLSNETLLEKETPTFFQKYAPIFLQTLIAKLKTEHNNPSSVLENQETLSSEILFQRKPIVTISSSSPNEINTYSREEYQTFIQHTSNGIEAI